MQPRRILKQLQLGLALASAPAAQAHAHASEQSLVLLLPTDIYTGAGVAAVAATVVLLALLPAGAMARLYRPIPLTRLSLKALKPFTSLAAFALLALLVWAGLTGPRDPLSNPLPLFVWTVYWIGFITLQATLGDLWAYLNPWTGPFWLARKLFRPWSYARLPPELGHTLGIIAFLGFAYLLLADPAPSDPDRLARSVATYWLFTFALTLIYGHRWLQRAEGFGLMARAYARLAIFGRWKGKLHAGLPGWQVLHKRPFPLGPSLLIVILLATGSFDGLNETFWWLGLININPLEFPGRSAVVWQSTLGLLASNAALIAVMAVTIALGLRLIGARTGIAQGLRLFAPSILPIALGYHIAHYLPSFLVDGQYALVALSDPFLTGADYLGLGQFYVTTGFFNTTATVRVIFLSQAGAVVAGHILAVMLAHAIAVRDFGTTRGAALSQAPLAAFMIAYTLFGLWLLASPRF
ncbi:MAG: hypothetical protein QNJ16_01225 [Rhodobacter sp.]|nr:hypothetical protein [Rhodobacter sp.]